MRKLVYLACPYSSDDPKQIHHRFEWSWKACIWGWRQGFYVYSPVAYTHIIACFVPGIPHETWMVFDLNILSKCHQLWVLTLPGYQNSRGIAQEIDIARQLGIPVIEIDPARVQQETQDLNNWQDIVRAVQNFVK